MLARSSLLRPGRFGWLLLVVAMLAARSVAPEGWMPVASDGGGFEITVCNGMGPGEVMVLSKDGTIERKAPAKGQPSDHACAFAGIGLASTPPLAALPMPAPATQGVAPVATGVTVPGRGLAAPPPPATGPPLLA